MSSRFLILDGLGNRRPRGHWQLLAWCLDEEAVADFGACRSVSQQAQTRVRADPARRS